MPPVVSTSHSVNNQGTSASIARFITDTHLSGVQEPLSAELIAIMKLSLLDWCTVAMAGTSEPVSRIVRQMLLAEGGAPQAHVFGEPEPMPLRAAALANATTSHALDYDDTHFLHVGHTSVVVLSAALAVAQASQASGMQLLEASIIGTEVACHVGNWLGRSHYLAGFHQTATAGTYGAAAAAAKLLQLDEKKTGHALGLAATRASGLKSQFGTMGKPYNAGMAAMNGVEVALLAAAGFESRPDSLECEQGFGDTHHAQTGDAGARRLQRSENRINALGNHYVLVDTQHKLHACCHGLHASIEALLELRHEHQLEAMNIKAIHIRTNPRWINVCNKPAPVTGLEAKFSYRFVAAVVFSELDTAALTTYSDENCHDTQLHFLRDRTRVEADPELPDTASTVTILLQDGRTFTTTHDIAAHQPVSARQEKVLGKSSVLLGPAATTQLWSCIDSLPSLQVADLVQAIKDTERGFHGIQAVTLHGT